MIAFKTKPFALAGLFLGLAIAVRPVAGHAESIIDEWSSVKIPPPPVLHTAAEAALRGYKVIVPVDGMSGDSAYPEQYTAWHLANTQRVMQQVTLTKIDLIGY